MKKIVSILLVIIFGCSIIASAETQINHKFEKLSSENEIKSIRVAIYTDEVENDDFYGPYGRTRYFMWALKDYTWDVGDTIYRFEPSLLSTDQLLYGELTTDNYDVLVYPPDTANEYLLSISFRFLPKNIMRVRNINKFIDDGGGYIGSCGSAIIAGKFDGKPKTLLQIFMKKSSLKISNIIIKSHSALPVLSDLYGHPSDIIGEGAYLWFSGWNQTDMDINYHTGVCLDVQILKDNPIFHDYEGDTRKIRWVSGPELIIPEDTESNIRAIARFPEEEMSDNESTQIHYWKYTGGYSGMIKGLLYKGGEIHYADNVATIMKPIIFSKDWENTGEVVKTNYSNKPFIITEENPNKNNARIVLSSGHPEDNVWWGGHIEELEDTNNNMIYDGFHKWVDLLPVEGKPNKEFYFNYWIIRRCIAWASKIVPDDSLPPIEY